MDDAGLSQQLTDAINLLNEAPEGSTAIALRELAESWPDGSQADLAAICRKINVGKALRVDYRPDWAKLGETPSINPDAAGAVATILGSYAAVGSAGRGDRYKLLNAAFELVELAGIEEPALLGECLADLAEASRD